MLFVSFWLYVSSDCRLTLWDAFQVVTAEGEAQGFVWFTMQLSVISMAVPLGPISHLQVQNLEVQGAWGSTDHKQVHAWKNVTYVWLKTYFAISHGQFLPEASPHLKIRGQLNVDQGVSLKGHKKVSYYLHITASADKDLQKAWHQNPHSPSLTRKNITLNLLHHHLSCKWVH